jgi:hypothetical protein
LRSSGNHCQEDYGSDYLFHFWGFFAAKVHYLFCTFAPSYPNPV